MTTFDTLIDTARHMAHRYRLVMRDGHILCWNCHQAEALLPSLHCRPCLEWAYSRIGAYGEVILQREQNESDWAVLKDHPQG